VLIDAVSWVPKCSEATASLGRVKQTPPQTRTDSRTAAFSCASALPVTSVASGHFRSYFDLKK